MQRSPLVIVEDAAHGRAIIQNDVPRRIVDRRRRSVGWPNVNGRIGARVGLLLRLPLLLQYGLLDAPQAADLPPHLHLGVTVRLQNRLGHVAQEMIVAIAMWDTRK